MERVTAPLSVPPPPLLPATQFPGLQEVLPPQREHSSYIELASSLLGWGSAITSYSYRVQITGSGTWSPDWTNITGGASARSQTVMGLTNGTNYTFELKAVNGEGDSSSVSATATPVSGNTVSGAPRNFIATAGNTQVKLKWQPPTSDGGSAITHYSYRARKRLKHLEPPLDHCFWRRQCPKSNRDGFNERHELYLSVKGSERRG